MNTNKIIGFVVTSTLAPKRATQYMTYSHHEGAKVHIVPGDVVSEVVAAARNQAYWDLQLKQDKRAAAVR